MFLLGNILKIKIVSKNVAVDYAVYALYLLYRKLLQKKSKVIKNDIERHYSDMMKIKAKISKLKGRSVFFPSPIKLISSV